MKPSKLRYFFYGGPQLDPELKALFRGIRVRWQDAQQARGGDATPRRRYRSHASSAGEPDIAPVYGDERTLDQLRTLTELAALLSRLGPDDRRVLRNQRLC